MDKSTFSILFIMQKGKPNAEGNAPIFARIREAFVTHFKENLSTNYIVNGERGEAKRLLLNRELVTWE